MAPEFPDTAVSSAMCLWAEYVDKPVDVARQAILYVHASFASELSQQTLSADSFSRLHLLAQAAA